MKSMLIKKLKINTARVEINGDWVVESLKKLLINQLKNQI